MTVPLLAASLGCPAGVGPDVAVRAAARLRRARCLLVGDHEVIRAAARRARIATRRLKVVPTGVEARRLSPGSIGMWAASEPLTEPVERGRPSPAAGAAALAWIAEGCDLCAQRCCDALVTGPVSKEVIASSGAPGAHAFVGHTEYLAERLGAKEVTMAFSGRKLTTALVTTHLPIAEVPSSLTAPRVARACSALAELTYELQHRPVRLAVAALNPHAGEGGMFGAEEGRAIVPGIARARRRIRRAGIPAVLEGPLGAETAYRLAVGGHYDGVVAMYHDQATIPCKLVGFGDMVNVTLGLPVVRTSVDHGTAYDRAVAGGVSSQSMASALALAARLVSSTHR